MPHILKIRKATIPQSGSDHRPCPKTPVEFWTCFLPVNTPKKTGNDSIQFLNIQRNDTPINYRKRNTTLSV